MGLRGHSVSKTFVLPELRVHQPKQGIQNQLQVIAQSRGGLGEGVQTQNCGDRGAWMIRKGNKEHRRWRGQSCLRRELGSEIVSQQKWSLCCVSWVSQGSQTSMVQSREEKAHAQNFSQTLHYQQPLQRSGFCTRGKPSP